MNLPRRYAGTDARSHYSLKEKAATAPERKSGMLSLRPGDVLFREGDKAASLYIIQKGQLRLFKPKGKGFVELAVLRSGEVVGEMAYFAENDFESRRSCSAEALVPSEIIEISFNAFAKTMSNLNPWFRTIINTLISRLRKTNALVKELESNSVSYGYGPNAGTYSFFKTIDIIRLLSMFYLVVKGQGEESAEGVKIHKNAIKFYCLDLFNLGEAKLEKFVSLLNGLGMLNFAHDKDKAPNIYVFPDVASLRSVMIFINTQRVSTDDKKIKISPRCELFLTKIIEKIQKDNITASQTEVDIKAILEVFKDKNIAMEVEDLNQAREAGFVSEVMIKTVNDETHLSCVVYYDKLKSNFLPVKLMNAVEKINERRER